MNDTMTETQSISLLRMDLQSTASEAMALKVIDAAHYGKAADIAKVLVDKIKHAESRMKPHIARANVAHKELIAELNDIIAAPQRALAAIKIGMNEWTMAERRRIAEAEALIARKAKEEADAKRLIDAERAEMFAKEIGLPADMVDAAVNEVLEAPSQQVAARIRSTVPKLEGVSVRTNWEFEIVDKRLIPAQFLIVDTKAIGALVRIQKGETSIPGVRVYSVANTVIS